MTFDKSITVFQIHIVKDSILQILTLHSVRSRSFSVGRGRYLATDLTVDFRSPDRNDFFGENCRFFNFKFVKVTFLLQKL